VKSAVKVYILDFYIETKYMLEPAQHMMRRRPTHGSSYGT